MRGKPKDHNPGSPNWTAREPATHRPSTQTPLQAAATQTTWFCNFDLQEVRALSNMFVSKQTASLIHEHNLLIQTLRDSAKEDYQTFKRRVLANRKK